MAELLAHGQSPVELMGHYASEDARRGRNERCTCGSGRKWKQCHGTDGGPRDRRPREAVPAP
jgi:uncharacterized protein